MKVIKFRRDKEMGEVIRNRTDQITDKNQAIEEAKRLYSKVLGGYPTNFNRDYYTDLDKIVDQLAIIAASKDFSRLFKGLNTNKKYRDASGLLINKDEKFYIYSNSNENADRQRFTIAHEIGHYKLNHIPKMEGKNFIMRDQVSSSGTDKKEICANAFAAELLMPEQLVKELVKMGYSEREMALGLRVSISAIRNRLDSLKL